MGNHHSRVRSYSGSRNRSSTASMYDRHHDRRRQVTTNMHAKSAPVQAGNPDLWSPPPYTPQQPSNASAPRASSSGDSPYSFLREFDTVFLVDDSGSMRGSRWNEAADAIAAIAPVCTAHDQDGIDISRRRMMSARFFTASSRKEQLRLGAVCAKSWTHTFVAWRP